MYVYNRSTKKINHKAITAQADIIISKAIKLITI